MAMPGAAKRKSARRWQRRQDARSAEILEAALACFAQKGFAATRMDDIARRAHISKGTIYLYFENKEAVFKALARGAVGAQLTQAKGLIAAHRGSAADLLRLVLSCIGHFVSTSDRVVLPRLLLAEAGNFPELARFWRQEVIDQGLAVFEAIIRRGQAGGEFRDLPPSHAARLCIAPMLVIMLWRATFAQFDDEPYDYDGLVQAHLATLLHGLSVRGER
jgi:AcrR family transcriptional regulator